MITEREITLIYLKGGIYTMTDIRKKIILLEAIESVLNEIDYSIEAYTKSSLSYSNEYSEKYPDGCDNPENEYLFTQALIHREKCAAYVSIKELLTNMKV